MCIELWLLCTFTPSIVQRCKVQTGWLKLVTLAVSSLWKQLIQKLNKSVTFLRSVAEPHLFSPNLLLLRGDDFVEPITSTQNFKKTQRSLWTTLGKATAETCLDSYVTLRQKPSKMSILRTMSKAQFPLKYQKCALCTGYQNTPQSTKRISRSEKYQTVRVLPALVIELPRT